VPLAPRPPLAVVAAPALLFALGLAGSARAEPADGVRIELHALRGLLGLEGRAFVAMPPYQSAGLQFAGAGSETGGEFDLVASLHGVRFGFSFSGFAVSGTRLGHGPLGPDLSASLAAPWGVTVPIFAGWEANLGRVRPYADLRVGLGLLHWEIDPRSARVGALTPLTGTQAYPVVTPRLGVSFWITHQVVIDGAFSSSPVGIERASFLLGVGYAPALPPQPRGPAPAP